MENKLSSDIPGLDKLVEALSEASEIEKCSICLENLENTVSLWPCSHWFCRKCISNWRDSVKSEKATCPLCKGPAARRSILDFEEEQKKRADILQRLIGALSLDLGFDITSYKKSNGSNLPKTKSMEQNDESSCLSPQIKTRRKTVAKKSKIKTCTISCRNMVTRSSKSMKPAKTETPVPSAALNLLEDSNEDDLRDKKVKEWLDSTTFSQTEDNFKETVVADIHIPDSEITNLSEEQLKSVTQVDESLKQFSKCSSKIKSCETLSDVDGIKPFDELAEVKLEPIIHKKQTSKKQSPVLDVFDSLLSQKKKGQLVKTTYGGKTQLSSNTKNRRLFPIHSQSDNFISVDSMDEYNESEVKSFQESSQISTLLDFSSGSGEEWVAYDLKEKSKPVNKKKSCKNSKFNSNECADKKTRKSSRLSKSNNQQSSNEKDIHPLNNSKLKQPESKSSISSINKFLDVSFRKNKCQDLVENLTSKWKEADDSNCSIQPTNEPKNQITSKTYVNTTLKLTPVKLKHQRSPGWSRLSTTKKEFHMSEKKKLSLKTLNNSNTRCVSDTSVCAEEDSLIDCQQTNLDGSRVNLNGKKEHLPIKEKSKDESLDFFDADLVQVSKAKFEESKSETNLNNSLALTTSPFKGFLSPKTVKDTTNLQNIDSIEMQCIIQIPKDQQLINSCDKVKKSDIKETEDYYSEFSIHKTALNHKANECSTKIKLEEGRQKCELSSNLKQINSLPLISENIRTESNLILNKSDVIDFASPCVDVAVNSTEFQKVQKSLTSHCKESKDNDNLLKFSKEILQKEIGGNICKSKVVEGHILNLCEDKKRSRDCSVNDGEFESPFPKRICQDAEVQTSPSRHESYIEEYVVNVWGIDGKKLKEIASNKNNNILKNKEMIPNILKSHEVNPETVPNYLSNLSQDSDKENNCLSSAANINFSKKLMNDSDIILGTEDFAGHILKSVGHKFKCPQTPVKPLSPLVEDFGMEEDCTIDPDAITQPFKTPVGLKRTLEAVSTHVYSAISNPTDSELKKANDLFLQDEVLFMNNTPKIFTPWNSSGVEELEDTNSKSIKKESLICSLGPSQKGKDKSNRSRRQLDFLEDESLSNDMFDVAIKEEIVSKEINSKPIQGICNVSSNIEDDDIKVAFQKLSKHDKPSELFSKELMKSNNNSLDNSTTPLLHCYSDNSGKISQDTNVCGIEWLRNNKSISLIPLASHHVTVNPHVIVKENRTKPLKRITTIGCNTVGPSRSSPINNNYHFNTDNFSIALLYTHDPHDGTMSYPGKIVDLSMNLKKLNDTVKSNHLTLKLIENNDLPRSDKADNDVEKNDLLSRGNKVEDDELSNASSMDCLVEGTPEGSQDEMQSNPPVEEEYEKKIIIQPQETTEKGFACGTRGDSSIYKNLDKMSSDGKNQYIRGSTPCKNLGKKSSQGTNRQAKRTTSSKRTSKTSQTSDNLLGSKKAKNERSDDNNDENDKSDDEKLDDEKSEDRESDDENYLFSSSLLIGQQNYMLHIVLDNFNIPFSRVMTPNVSHLVVGTNNRRTQNTYKVLYAMALHKTIISFDWVERALKAKAGETIDLDSFLALDPSGECGVLRAKQDKKRILLQDFAIHIYNVSKNLITKEQLEEIVQLCGATVVSSLSQFLTVPRDKFRVIIYSDPPDTITQTDYRKRYDAAEVVTDWIYNTVGRYRVVPLLPFMVDQTDSLSFLQHQGYPEELLYDPPTQQQSTVV